MTDSSGCPFFIFRCIFFIISIIVIIWHGKLSDVAEIDVYSLHGGFAVLFVALVNYDFTYEASKYRRCQFLNV